MRFTRLALIAGLVLASTLLLAAPPASAHGVKFARAVGGDFFPESGPPYSYVQGQVRSPNRRCRRRSFVILFRRTPGQDVNMGADGTGTGRTFRIDAPGGGTFPSGSYYLVVRRKVLRNTLFHRHICPRLQTNTFSF